jgi:hypothetical protein
MRERFDNAIGLGPGDERLIGREAKNYGLKGVRRLKKTAPLAILLVAAELSEPLRPRARQPAAWQAACGVTSAPGPAREALAVRALARGHGAVRVIKSPL